MGFFSSLFGEKKTSGQVNDGIDKARWYTIEYQQFILRKLNELIPGIMLGGNPACTDYPLSRADESDRTGPNNMLIATGRIAYSLDNEIKISSFEMIEEILGELDESSRIFCLAALEEYENTLKADYNRNIHRLIELIKQSLNK